VTSLKGVGIPRQQQVLRSPAVSTIAEERPETQESRRSQLPTMARDFDDPMYGRTETPGGETSYIRFAIDQLTRDEEVRGSRLYPRVPAAQDEDDYPVERLVPDEGLGYMEKEQRRERRVRPPKPAPAEPIFYHSDYHDTSLQPPASTTTRTRRDDPSTGELHRYSSHAQLPTSTVQKDIFVSQSLPHSPLRFLPSILRPLWLGIFILLCLAMLAALIFSAAYSDRNNGLGLYDYLAFGDARYFVFEYLPTMLGMVILMWLLQIQIAVQRIVPFISMTSNSTRQRSEAVFLELYPMQFVLPRLEHFRAGQPLVGVFYVISWLFTWTIPLLAAAFNVRYDLDRQVWKWIAVQGVIWTVIVLYILLVVALLILLFIVIRSETGLRWDPRSLADIIALLERSNIVNDYDGSETFDKSEFKQRLGHRADRIGYWSTTKRPNDLFHGIGEEGGSPRRYSVEQGRIREKGPIERADPPLQGTQRPGDFSIRMDIRSPEVRLKYLPWYLRDTSVIAWIVIALILLIAFLVVSYVNSAVRLGWLPEVYARTSSSGFSASNFLYSFVPAIIAHFLFLAMLTLDYSFRTLRPYISLASKGGATAETSLLIDYSSRLPISVTVAALENRHYQTAILSLVSLCSTTLPVLAGGCFWTQYYPNSDVVRVAADLPGYYALCFFLALYAVSFFALLPGRKRAALPHRSSSLAEIISWLYQSPILTDRAFSRPQTKPELVARLMGSEYLDRTWARSLTSLVRPSRQNLRGDSPTDPTLTGDGHGQRGGKARQRGDADLEKRTSVLEPGRLRYGFGIFVGRDGLEHLGIERVKRGGERSARELVIWEEQRRRSWVGSIMN
jgi:hypothetical protein